MCSSPKSSGLKKRATTSSIFASMDPSTRAKFVEKANQAQERREARIALNAEYKRKKPGTRGQKNTHQHSVFLSLLSKLGFAV
ncbi:hypothetical protein J3L16_03235 [Alteromonas sp. 5E99-2]|uniref:hypothetical protein n=1 Tax=Alteromonas sp. 5E99-2 TaxID=2817683 RepID=UPI001A99668C|nr:hypothetical protein [Alteromonas sp. 5E99-2]MBO1254698.1 hypothetical protein [Alteromonas sp. 5E99-2]